MQRVTVSFSHISLTCSLSLDFSFFPPACGMNPLLGSVVCLASVWLQQECKILVLLVLWPGASELMLGVSLWIDLKGSSARKRTELWSVLTIPFFVRSGTHGFMQNYSSFLTVYSVCVCVLWLLVWFLFQNSTPLKRKRRCQIKGDHCVMTYDALGMESTLPFLNYNVLYQWFPTFLHQYGRSSCKSCKYPHSFKTRTATALMLCLLLSLVFCFAKRRK